MSGRLVFGIIVLFLGVKFLLQELGVNTDQITQYLLPALLILLGLVKSIKRKSVQTFDLFLIVVGLLLLLQNLNILRNSNIWSIIWPIFLVIIGINLIVPKKNFSSKEYVLDKTTSKENTIDSFALFGGNDSKVTSKEFKGGNINCMFGGVKLDLLDADIKENEPARIELVNMFGGTEIWVPKDWNVKIEGFPIFGGWENKADATGSNKTLIINATVMFGGLEVKSR